MRLNHHTISILIMPTERERDSYNPEIKDEHIPGRRLRFLDHAVPDHSPSIVIKAIVVVLAVYGLYSLIFS